MGMPRCCWTWSICIVCILGWPYMKLRSSLFWTYNITCHDTTKQNTIRHDTIIFSRTGIVTCEAIKAGGFPPKLTTTFLKVDYETGNEGEVGGTREEDQTYFIKGSPEDFSRVSKRSGLSLATLGRAVHIEKAAAGRHQPWSNWTSSCRTADDRERYCAPYETVAAPGQRCNQNK